MIKAVFTAADDNSEKLIGFTVAGHSGSAEKGQDIICAGVSSAVMLTINTITDFIGAIAEVDVSPDKEGYASLLLTAPYSEQAVTMIKSFFAHLTILEEEYGHISVRLKNK